MMDKAYYDIDVYMICPVRKATDEEKAILESYRNKLRGKGLKVHYPAEDTVQEDPTRGYQICMDHCDEISRSRAVHVYWNKSEGSYVDFGIALREYQSRGLDILLINREDVESLVAEQKKEGLTKSYEMVLLRLDDIADSFTRV